MKTIFFTEALGEKLCFSPRASVKNCDFTEALGEKLKNGVFTEALGENSVFRRGLR